MNVGDTIFTMITLIASRAFLLVPFAVISVVAVTTIRQRSNTQVENTLREPSAAKPNGEENSHALQKMAAMQNTKRNDLNR